MSVKKNFASFSNEIELLDKIYLDLVSAIHEKPSNNDIEALRLYVDNLYSMLNGSALRINEVKKLLLEDEKLIHETWNPPA